MWVLRSTDKSIHRALRITPGTTKTLGRGLQADFVIDAPLVSRVHCNLSASANGLEVEDLGSTNGTFVNNQRVQRSSLREGDHLKVGRLVLSVSEE